jgi:hypothetical protein
MEQSELTAELRIQLGILESISKITKRILRDMRSIAQTSAKMQPLVQGPWTGKMEVTTADLIGPSVGPWVGTDGCTPWFPSNGEEDVADGD